MLRQPAAFLNAAASSEKNKKTKKWRISRSFLILGGCSGSMRVFLPQMSRRWSRRRHPTSIFSADLCYGYTAGTPRPTAVLSFGDNSMGALGLPFPLREAYEPTPVPSLPSDTTIAGVAAGHYHSLAVTSSGEVWAWGRNDEGQLGRGPETPRGTWNEPGKVQGLDHVKVKSAFASGVVSAALANDGSLWVWGRSKRGQLGLASGIIEAVRPSKVEAFEGEEIVKVSFGWGHALAQTSGGKLFGWGYAEDGRLGDLGKKMGTSSIPPSAFDMTRISRSNLSPMEVARKVVSDKMEKEKNMPIIWEPSAIELDGVKVSDVSCGLDHSIVLCSDGKVLSCGNNTYGQLGRNTEGCKMLPIEMPFPPVSLASGLGHSFALCKASPVEAAGEGTTVVSWGWSDSHQLGRQGIRDRPGTVEGLSGQKFVSVSAGRVHSLAVTSEGEVWIWGSGANGRLGLGSSADEPDPALLESLAGVNVLQAVCGFDHNLILVAE